MEYIINDDTIIFSPLFNKVLDYKLLSNYKKIIFSDADLDSDFFEKLKKK